MALNIAHILRYGRFLRYLKLHHTEHWKSIGSPEQFDDEPQYGEVGFAAYFASRRYAELGDPQLSMLGDKMLGMREWMFVGIVIFGTGCSVANGDWHSPTETDTFDRYDVPIGGITWHVKDGYFQKSSSARQSSW